MTYPPRQDSIMVPELKSNSYLQKRGKNKYKLEDQPLLEITNAKHTICTLSITNNSKAK